MTKSLREMCAFMSKCGKLAGNNNQGYNQGYGISNEVLNSLVNVHHIRVHEHSEDKDVKILDVSCDKVNRVILVLVATHYNDDELNKIDWAEDHDSRVKEMYDDLVEASNTYNHYKA